MNVGKDKKGYVLIAFIIMALLASLVIMRALHFVGMTGKAGTNSQLEAKDFLAAESAFNMTVSWLREQAENMTYPFYKSNFYKSFERSAPAIGDNSAQLHIPTKIKLPGGSYSIMLTNGEQWGKPVFPYTQSIATGKVFDPVEVFSKLDFGEGVEVRVTLIDGIPLNSSGDFGNNPKQPPSTDFYPIYKIDTRAGENGATHFSGYVVGSLAQGGSAGFLGVNGLTMKGECDSYNSAKGSYNKKSRTPQCSMSSEEKLALNKSGIVYGKISSAKKVNLKGQVCANFDSGCPVAGEVCQGTGCAIPAIPDTESWNTYCPKDQGTLVISKDTTLVVSGDSPLQKCWESIVIKKKVTLTLETTEYPFFIRDLNFEKANSRLIIAPRLSGKAVTLYVEKISGAGADKLDGAKIVNTTDKASQFFLYYLGSRNISVVGKGNVFMALIAPFVKTTLSLKGEFFGGIFTDNLVANAVTLHMDEAVALGSGGGGKLEYLVREVSQNHSQ